MTWMAMVACVFEPFFRTKKSERQATPPIMFRTHLGVLPPFRHIMLSTDHFTAVAHAEKA